MNSTNESRLSYPADIKKSDEKVEWLYRELERIIHEHDDISQVCIKTNEFTQSDSKSKRESAYLEGVILLFCRQESIPVSLSLYTSLGTRSSDVKLDAEKYVGRTERYWDSKMADAVMAAYKGIRD